MDELRAAYGTSSHATFVKSFTSDAESVVDYEPLKLSSFRVFFLKRGTILANPVLFSEQILLTLIFFGLSLPVYLYFKQEAPAGNDVSLGRFLRQQEPKMRQFAMIMTGLAAFLLSFYTSIAVTRWWTMRTAGVGAIKAATVDLQMLISTCVTKDKSVLDAIERYGRVSLMLIFLWRQKELGNMKEIFMDPTRQLLKPEEMRALEKARDEKCGALHEMIWAWQAAIVNRLYEAGKIKSDQLYALLLEKCADGRAAAQCVHTHLAVRVPMQYVHLLGFLVKMHNIVVAVIMGLLFGAALRNGYVILCVQLFARTLILPFLFNAILLINCDLSDPFNGGEADFPGDQYQDNLGKDCKGIIEVSENQPTWMKDPTVV